ncbi:MAG: TadE family protein [Planctomycetota bacterium]
MPSITNRGETGSAAVEFAILLPVYVLCAMGLIHLGGLSIARTDATRAVILASWMPGIQTEGDLPANYLTEHGGNVYPASKGSVTKFLDTETGEDVYTAHDVEENLDEIAREPVGRYVFEDGVIKYVIDTDNLGPYGKYILDNNLKQYADPVAEIMNGWMKRGDAQAEYTFRAPLAGLDAVTVTGATKSVIRGSEERGHHPSDGVTDFNTTVVKDLIGQDLPGFGNTQKFWIPN